MLGNFLINLDNFLFLTKTWFSVEAKMNYRNSFTTNEDPGTYNDFDSIYEPVCDTEQWHNTESQYLLLGTSQNNIEANQPEVQDDLFRPNYEELAEIVSQASSSKNIKNKTKRRYKAVNCYQVLLCKGGKGHAITVKQNNGPGAWAFAPHKICKKKTTYMCPVCKRTVAMLTVHPKHDKFWVDKFHQCGPFPDFNQLSQHFECNSSNEQVKQRTGIKCFDLDNSSNGNPVHAAEAVFESSFPPEAHGSNNVQSTV